MLQDIWNTCTVHVHVHLCSRWFIIAQEYTIRPCHASNAVKLSPLPIFQVSTNVHYILRLRSNLLHRVFLNAPQGAIISTGKRLLGCHGVFIPCSPTGTTLPAVDSAPLAKCVTFARPIQGVTIRTTVTVSAREPTFVKTLSAVLSPGTIPDRSFSMRGNGEVRKFHFPFVT